MNIIADTHCHTLASTHAYSTALENINAAKRKGLYAIALTDHGPAMPGAPGKWFFRNLMNIPRITNGVLVLRGVEANILNDKGEIDLDLEYEHARLDYVIASIHTPLFPQNTDVDYRTSTYMNIANNKVVNTIGHSGQAAFSYDFEKVIKEFGRCGKLVEINNHSFVERASSIPNCIKIAKLCKKHSVNVILNSDAHFCERVGEVSRAYQMLREIGFPDELIINADLGRFKKYLRENTSVFNEI